MAAQATKQFKLGEQPEWAGRERNADIPISFIESLLKEDSAESLINRGYCLVKLDAETTSFYSKFHTLIEQFFALKATEKEQYALLQFDAMNNSPNQCHGYSQVSCLKEQFMMRCIGRNENHSNNYTFPNCGDGNFGKYGMLIYQSLDLKARDLAKQTMLKLGKSSECVDDILDPINEIRAPLSDNISQNGPHSVSSFMPNDYISSSIMDNFHYFAPSKEKHERFFNNHSSHTDSGLMTVVIVTDEPGLEIFDQSSNKWIQIESLIQRYLTEREEYSKDPLCHRRYATFFWSDSVEYLNNAPIIDRSGSSEYRNKSLQALFHRVGDCERERYSVVFKQRTAPLRTHCRYQEDYILASIQQKVDTKSKNAYTLWNDKGKNIGNDGVMGGFNAWVYGSIAAVTVSAVCFYAMRNVHKAYRTEN